jgi:hypothetical protein
MRSKVVVDFFSKKRRKSEASKQSKEEFVALSIMTSQHNNGPRTILSKRHLPKANFGFADVK